MLLEARADPRWLGLRACCVRPRFFTISAVPRSTICVLLITAATLNAQPLRVYSEFARIDAAGEVSASSNPREILSPAIARNAFTSFQIVVQPKKGERYWMYLGQNPADAVRVTLYRESGERLKPVEIPYGGEGTQVFWMDVWTDRNAPVRRIRIEPQLHIGAEWVVYPMEARVMTATVPDSPPPGGSMMGFLCGKEIDSAVAPLSIAGVHFRNAQQDLALARQAPQEDLQRLAAGCRVMPPADPEWYLRVRDYLFRMR